MAGARLARIKADAAALPAHLVQGEGIDVRTLLDKLGHRRARPVPGIGLDADELGMGPALSACRWRQT